MSKHRMTPISICITLKIVRAVFTHVWLAKSVRHFVWPSDEKARRDLVCTDVVQEIIRNLRQRHREFTSFPKLSTSPATCTIHKRHRSRSSVIDVAGTSRSRRRVRVDASGRCDRAVNLFG